MSDDENNSGESSGKRSYTMSDAAIQQRRDAAQNSTGPVTEEGKAISSRNAWKHGDYSILARSKEWQAIMPLWKATGKPCQTTCDKYPCSLVEDGLTREGQNCMDKQVFVQAFDAIMSSLATGDAKHAHGMVGMLAASSVDILVQMRDEIAANGVLIQIPVTDSKGNAIKLKDEDGEEFVVTKPVMNPAIPHYTKLLDTMGINLPELLLTPQASRRIKTDEEAVDTLGETLGRLTDRFGMRKRPGRTIDVTPDKE